MDINRLNAAGRFVELVHLDSAQACMPATTKIVEVIESNADVDQVALRSVDFILSELTENIFHHSLSSSGGFICCQSYPSERVIRVGIVDLGVGIEPALQENPQNATVLETTGPLSPAIKARITGRPGFNTGLGLFWTSKIIECNEGRLGIHSTRFRLVQDGTVTRIFFAVVAWHSNSFKISLRQALKSWIDL